MEESKWQVATSEKVPFTFVHSGGSEGNEPMKFFLFRTFQCSYSLFARKSKMNQFFFVFTKSLPL